MSRKKHQEAEEQAEPASAPPTSLHTPDQDRIPLSVVDLMPNVNIRMEWLDGGHWRSKDITGRIIPPHPTRDPTTTEQCKGVSLFHCIDHIQIELNGCVRCVPFGQVRYWGFDPPQDIAGGKKDAA